MAAVGNVTINPLADTIMVDSGAVPVGTGVDAPIVIISATVGAQFSVERRDTGNTISLESLLVVVPSGGGTLVIPLSGDFYPADGERLRVRLLAGIIGSAQALFQGF